MGIHLVAGPCIEGMGEYTSLAASRAHTPRARAIIAEARTRLVNTSGSVLCWEMAGEVERGELGIGVSDSQRNGYDAES